jgi:hypothetical protein
MMAVPARLQPFEDLGLGIGDRLHAAEVLDVRGRDGGDQRDVRSNQLGQRRNFAGVAHAHLEHAIDAVARHPGKAERHPGVVVGALERAVDPAAMAAFKRCGKRFLGAGLADRAGDPEHGAGHPGAACLRQILQRLGDVGHQHMRAVDWAADQGRRGALVEGSGDEVVPVSDGARHRHEEPAGLDPHGCRR